MLKLYLLRKNVITQGTVYRQKIRAVEIIGALLRYGTVEIIGALISNFPR